MAQRPHAHGMTIAIIIPLLVCILGLLVYALAANPKVSEMGRLSFACGLLVTLFAFAGHVFRF